MMSLSASGSRVFGWQAPQNLGWLRAAAPCAERRAAVPGAEVTDWRPFCKRQGEAMYIPTDKIHTPD
jgi:hypothetical protein